MEHVTLPQLKQWASELNFAEQLSLLEHIALSLQATEPAKAPQDLRGIWKGRVPEDFDVESAVREMRREWEKEWTDAGDFVG